MPLAFPNPSRSFDSQHGYVQFWGYENAIEISFFVDADALQKLHPGMDESESAVLKAFDQAKPRIHAVASQIYARRTRGTFAFNLAAADF